jgi:hypothetical protein
MFMRRSLMTAMTVLGMTAGTLAFAPGAADAAPSGCIHPNPDNSHHTVMTNGWGTGIFEAYDDVLKVVDLRNDGHRTYVHLDVCEGGQWVRYGAYSSGPNEGNTDRERYDFNFTEGRRIRFQVCVKQDGSWVGCSETEYGYA